MQRKQGITHQTDGSSALENLGLPQETETIARPSWMQNHRDDPQIEDFFHIEPIMAATGLTIAFCMIWYLTVLVLYQLAQIALPI